MKHLQFLWLGCLLWVNHAWADNILPLNQISLQLTAEQWVVTKTANVIVGIDASLNGAQLAAARQEILQKLAKFVPGAEWHITIFDRSQDSSGLEKLHIEAQARVLEQALGNIRQQAKTNSKPGQTYTLLAIDYTPTLAEVEAVRSILRNKIYSQVKDEVNRLNNLYPSQQYYVHRIDFGSVQTTAPMERMTLAAAKTNDMGQAEIPVSNKSLLQANVVLASTINGLPFTKNN